MRVLITGTSGFLASRVRDCLSEDPSMFLLTPGHRELDITKLDNCRSWFEVNHPDAVIHLAAISDISACEKEKERSYLVNTIGPENLARCAREFALDSRFIHASSDQVYTGSMDCETLHNEAETLSPANLYAREKLEAEEKVAALLPDAMALRLPWMFDLLPGKTNYLKLLVLSIMDQQPVKYAENELRTENYAREIAEGIRQLLLSNATAVPGGAYNFGGPPSGTSYETAQQCYALLGRTLDMPWEGLAIPVQLDHPRSLAMDQTRLQNIGISLRDTVSSVDMCLKQEYDWLKNVRQADVSELY